MRQDVTVVFGPGEAVQIPVAAGQPLASPDEGRRWLDEQFVALDCEPLRASGKVLIADKLLAIALSVGRQRFDTDAAFREAYARAALAAMARAVVRVDLVDGRVVA
ncbi:MAG: hypothetical protein KBC73_00750 [Burkholderiaceae bacterium]|nr:hypothetical protein [Burkholderiaceae bacterium]